MSSNLDTWIILQDDMEPLKGNNFLVSSILMLRKQKKDLQDEVRHLKERLALLESQNAAFMNLSADRLLEKLG